jgi:hypothetical protein
MPTPSFVALCFAGRFLVDAFSTGKINSNDLDKPSRHSISWSIQKAHPARIDLHPPLPLPILLCSLSVSDLVFSTAAC